MSRHGAQPRLTEAVNEVEPASAVSPDLGWDVLNALPGQIAVVDAAGRVLAVNQAWRRFAGGIGRAEHGTGWNYLTACDTAAAGGDDTAAATANLIRGVIRGGDDPAELVYRLDGPGETRWLAMRVVRLGGDSPPRVAIEHHDITAEHLAQAQLRLQARLLNEVETAVLALDRSGRVAFWNPEAARLYGWAAGDVLGREIKNFFPDGAGNDVAGYMEQLKLGGAWEGVRSLPRQDGSTVPVQIRDSVLRDANGEPEWMVGLSSDATARVARETELRSARDYLRAVAESIPDGMFALAADGAVTYLNPEAERLLGWRIGEFHDGRIHRACHDRRPGDRGAAPNRVVQIEDDTFEREDGTMLPVSYKASPFETATGVQGTVVIFRDTTDAKERRDRQRQELSDLEWAGRVRDALEHERFTLYAQPIVEIATGDVVQHELLLRMIDDGEVITPGEFLPAAERHNLMVEIDQWVLDAAIRIAARGHHIELNISADSLSRTNIYNEFEARLRTHRVDPGLIVVEITETGLVTNEAAAARLLERLAALGCQIALDDFGTGYGGFTYLKRLTVHYLKIDIEFVRDLTSNPASRSVIEAVVSLARGFGQKTVAEGVEDEATLAILAELGVDYAQGYLFGRPTPIKDTRLQGEHDEPR